MLFNITRYVEILKTSILIKDTISNEIFNIKL
jgi:hypothetical protein